MKEGSGKAEKHRGPEAGISLKTEKRPVRLYWIGVRERWLGHSKEFQFYLVCVKVSHSRFSLRVSRSDLPLKRVTALFYCI